MSLESVCFRGLRLLRVASTRPAVRNLVPLQTFSVSDPHHLLGGALSREGLTADVGMTPIEMYLKLVSPFPGEHFQQAPESYALRHPSRGGGIHLD